ncbi:MAG: sigma-70 family RNA polymerase sigma factor [Bacteroidota bacterium]
MKLIKSGAHGEEEAVDILWHDKVLRNQAFKIIHGTGINIDSSQTIFNDAILIALFSVQSNKFNGNNIRAYIVGICKNKSLEKIRREKKRREKDLVTDRVRISDIDTSPTPEQILIDSDLEEEHTEILRNHYQKLSKKCQEIIRDHYYMGESIAQMSKKFDIAYQSAKNRLSECRKKLRSYLEEDERIQKIVTEKVKLWKDQKK